MILKEPIVLEKSKILYFVIQVVLGTTLLWAMSQVSIPLTPVPISLQTVGVMAIGLLYRQKQALSTVGAYLLLGGSGVPLFANASAGWLVLFGPTGGYLVGFLVAVWLMTSVRTLLKKESLLNTTTICFLGTASVMMCGVAWLSLFTGFKQAIMLGLVPFIVPGIFKASLLSAAVWYVKKRG